MGGQQAADVITIVKDAQLERDRKPALTGGQKSIIQVKALHEAPYKQFTFALKS
jgi:hypothetical protein